MPDHDPASPFAGKSHKRAVSDFIGCVFGRVDDCTDEESLFLFCKEKGF